ncbi:MAG: trehalose-6-phosphate synthase [Actinomycetales bacterium]|nr:trehalose-6-phosphate synthase [Actinomycetales bacterium]
MSTNPPTFALVVVANRLPVDRVDGPSGPTWVTAPGGLVTALEPILAASGGAWVGWPGVADEAIDPFAADEIWLEPLELSHDEVTDYYEGFSNSTIWPIYHDVIVPATFERSWWQAFVRVNARFAERAAQVAAPDATVWVHDYHLQLVPQMLRELRPDVRIGYFAHIPFPPYELFAQLPWRTDIVKGMLGADLIGFQVDADVDNFLRATRALTGLSRRRGQLRVPDPHTVGGRGVTVTDFPISIDSAALSALAGTAEVAAHAAQVRADLGGRRIILGVDRLDYTKGIRHRLQAYAELLAEGRVDPAEVVLVQVATPSRERVEDYRRLRDEVELIVGRVNGDHASIGQPAVVYLHQSHDREAMAALYRAADVMLVTPLRDGMNLVAKEYVAAQVDGEGVLILSEFAGAAVELRQALLINPHDIAAVKETIVRAIRMPFGERRARMRQLRPVVLQRTVQRWAGDFFASLTGSEVAS